MGRGNISLKHDGILGSATEVFLDLLLLKLDPGLLFVTIGELA